MTYTEKQIETIADDAINSAIVYILRELDHQDGDVMRGRIGFHALADFVAAELGHHDVQQHEIGLKGLHQFERAGSVVRHLDLVRAVGEERFEQFAVLLVVVGDKNFRRWRRRCVGLGHSETF